MTTKQLSARTWSAGHPLVVAAVGWYLVFIALTYLGAGRWGFWFAVAWPYAFLLALQKFIASSAAFAAAWVLGSVLVVVFASFVQRAQFLRGRTALSVGLAALIWYLPLGALTLAAQGAARLFGWPYGE